MKHDVLYLDNHLLVVAKPPGLLSQADETGDLDLLTFYKRYLKQRFDKPGNVYLGLVHRLDRPASGIIVLARTSKAAARLSAQFRQHEVEKKYLALVEGNLTGSDRWTDFLVKEDRRSRVVTERHPKAKKASLRWRALACRDNATLVEIELETGRPHQIRLQFASRGFPLLGDPRYGAKRSFDGVNLALHCYRLALQHPVGVKAVSWCARPPGTWRGYFENEINTLMGKN